MRRDPPPSWPALPVPGSRALTGGQWVPGETTRVVIEASRRRALLAEARRIADELGRLTGLPVAVLDEAEGPPRPGDIVLGTRGGASAAREGFVITTGRTVEVIGGSATAVFRATRQLLQVLRATGGVPRGRVASAPQVAERALNLDIARKRYTAGWIGDRIREMADVGLTALQLHFSENEGVGVLSEDLPSVASPGALRPGEVERLLALAGDLHVEVIPSLDMPGHLGHVLRSFPDLRLRDARGAPVRGALNLADSRAWDLAERLMDAYLPLFPGASRWALGCDEFVDFDDVARYPALWRAAEERWGLGATPFDLLTAFANAMGERLRARGILPRVWNDGMFRSRRVRPDARTETMWWSNWSERMVPLAQAREDMGAVVNADDQHLYYVLGENAGYAHPTAERLWADGWHPGLFTPARGGPQEMPRPYPARLRGAMLSVWGDRPDAEDEQEVAERLGPLMRAFAERSWNGGSQVDVEEFLAISARLAEPPAGCGEGGAAAWEGPAPA